MGGGGVVITMETWEVKCFETDTKTAGSCRCISNIFSQAAL